MAASLQIIRKRQTSIHMIEKITKAMQLVSTAKLMKMRKRMESNREYYQTLTEAFNLIFSIANKQNLILTSPYFQTPPAITTTLYVVITSELGFCGAYNENLKKLIKQNLVSNDQVYVIGKKGLLMAQREAWRVRQSKVGFGGHLTMNDVRILSLHLLEMFNKKEFDRICLVFTHYVNSFTFEAHNFQLLPLSISEVQAAFSQNQIVKFNTAKQQILNFEPEFNEMITNLIPNYLAGVMYGKIIESHVAEQASRRISMENATQNADSLIEHLTIQFNQLRQSLITAEVNEIMAGSNN